MKNTGLSKAQMSKLRLRDHNLCIFMGAETERLVPQHRKNRGIGGDPTANTLENAVLIDSILNGLIEADANLAEIAKAYGIKVPIWADVTAVPVFFAHEHAWFLLEGDDRREITAVEALDRMHTVYGDEYFAWKARADQSPHAALLALRGR
ncbi:hypothetical protein B0I12_002534 [Microbacterium hydrothermale]|uniref:hypothetical protein n=1 Tax=Microbacterium hydrothermale TaxID=857427 RepID=UPI0022271F8E|nr:hypothetical protein [Microbacterium hydrothermale]MCW2165379.1 hypothetical protein [Microbacterium hydrothermale]